VTTTPRSALAAILTLTGNVDHATKTGANDALARGHLLNSIREIAQSVPPATEDDPVKTAMLSALQAALADFGPHYKGPTIEAMRHAVALATGNPATESVAKAHVNALDLVRIIAETPTPATGWTFDGIKDAMTSFVEDAQAIVADLDQTEA
jgi:hypothetical protein